MAPVEVGFDSLLDQPQRMMGLVVQVAADLGQDLWRDVGDVITLVGVAEDLHSGLANHGSQGGVGGAEQSPTGLQRCHAVQVRWEGRGLQEGVEPEQPGGEHHDDGAIKLQVTNIHHQNR